MEVGSNESYFLILSNCQECFDYFRKPAGSKTEPICWWMYRRRRLQTVGVVQDNLRRLHRRLVQALAGRVATEVQSAGLLGGHHQARLWQVEYFSHSNYFSNILFRDTRQSHNVAGVETRVQGWGNTDSVEYLGLVYFLSSHWSFHLFLQIPPGLPGLLEMLATTWVIWSNIS